jgi:GT2 family glycosyltransferase
MGSLRYLGIVLGAVAFVLVTVAHFRLQRLRRKDWLTAAVLSLALVWVGADPDSLNGVLGLFSFQAGGGGRLIGLLLFSSFVLYLLVFVSLSRTRAIEQTMDRLVRELAKREFRRSGFGRRAPIHVVIPAYNEGENIAAVLASVPPSVCGVPTKVIVVVDGATDDTASVVTSLEHAAVSCVINRGGGAALRAGFDLAAEAGADVVVTLDADGQHDPAEISRLVEPVIDGRADLVIGSRVLGAYEKDSHVRAAGVVVFNWMVSALTLRRITDCSNGFRAIRVPALARLDLRQRQFHTSELLLEAIKKGLRVIEVPVTIRTRAGGVSKKGPTLKYAIGFTRAILGTWLR